jgi:hypothetical protein
MERASYPPGDGDDIDLPPPDTARWTVRRKAAVVLAIRHGVLSFDAACERYRLSIEEFAAWEQAVERHCLPGLRITRFQIYRDTDKKRAETPLRIAHAPSARTLPE